MNGVSGSNSYCLTWAEQNHCSQTQLSYLEVRARNPQLDDAFPWVIHIDAHISLTMDSTVLAKRKSLSLKQDSAKQDVQFILG